MGCGDQDQRLVTSTKLYKNEQIPSSDDCKGKAVGCGPTIFTMNNFIQVQLSVIYLMLIYLVHTRYES